MIHEGLVGVVTTQSTISLVDGQKGHLVYRGHWAEEIAQKYSFEEVMYLLWFNRLPNSTELTNMKLQMKTARCLTEIDQQIIKNLDQNMDMMSVIRTVLSSKSTPAVEWPSTFEEGIMITASIPTIICYWHHLIHKQEPVAPDKELDHVENYLYMLNGKVPNEGHVRALTGYLILTMEHGMNASTFAARVIASTQSDLISAITGAIGAMKGPLHGGAPSGVIDLLENIGTSENAENYLRSLLESGDRLMGFGHRVYKTQDPRANALKLITSELSGDDPWFDLANKVEETAVHLLHEYKPGRKLYANVEFYAAAILKALELPTELFTPTFTMSRVVGWIANVYEQNGNNRIIRPSSQYVGKMPEGRR